MSRRIGNRSRGRSPRASRARLKNQVGRLNAPYINSPLCPPQALGRPPRIMTPCWLPQEFPLHLQHRGSPMAEMKKRRKRLQIFEPLKDAEFLVHNEDGTFTGSSHNNAQDFSNFLRKTNMPIKRLLPRLQNLSKKEIVTRIAAAKTFAHLMEGFHAKALQIKLSSGEGAKGLIDPSSHAWGDKSPRFSRNCNATNPNGKNKEVVLSTLSYRCSPLSTFNAERDTFYVS